MAKNNRNKRILLSLTTMMLTASMVVNAFADELSNKIKVTTDGQSVYYQTNDKTVGEFLKNNNIHLTKNHKLSVQNSDKITDGMQITIVSPKNVTVLVDGGEKKYTIDTQCETIGQLMIELKEKNATVGYKVADGHSSSEKLANGSVINLRSIKEEIYTETEELDFAVVEEKTDTLFVGEKQIKQKGVKGKKLITMKTIFYGNEQVDNFCIDRTVVQEPVNEIVLVGTKEKVVQKPADTYETTPGASASKLNYSKVVTMNATAYCPCAHCNGSWTGQPSAMGLKVERGIVAVDPKFIPLGTRLYVEGYGYCIAADTGGAIKGNRIDLCYNSHGEALGSGWGHTNVKVYILK